MKQGNFALFTVLLTGALCSCASAYYFPNGLPHRPSRQAENDTGFHPEPKQIPPVLPIDSIPTNNTDLPPLDILTFDGTPLKPDAQSRYQDEPSKPEPEPRDFSGVQLVPKRKETAGYGRQSGSCQQSYAFSQPGQSAVLQSPNYDREYPNNVETSMCFTSPDGTTMEVSCDDFNVEYSRTCAYDYLGIGLSGSPSSIQKYCGRGQLRSPATSGASLAIVFKSDYSNPGSTRRNPYRFSCTVTVSGSSGGDPPAPPPSEPPTDSGNCTCGKRNDGRIVGGVDAKVNEFPWRCYMKTNRYSFFCGCSIISNRWVLTAAHCTAAVMPLQNGDVLSVVVGDHIRSTSTDAASQQIAVETVYDHPKYNDRTMDYDASLLKLSRSISFTNTISSVCLPFNYANEEFAGTTVTASGWGTTSQGGSVSDVLKEVDLPVLTTSQCSQYYPGQITDRMICTYQPGKDTCQGDSGGSIDLNRNGKYYHIGIVSWGIGCAKDDNPGVYAKTTKFLDWITQTSGESFCRA